MTDRFIDDRVFEGPGADPDSFKRLPDDTRLCLLEEGWIYLSPNCALRTAEELGEWLARLDEHGVSDDLIQDIVEGLEAREARYPGRQPWDAIREHIAIRVLAAGNLKESLDLIFHLSSYRRMAKVLTDLCLEHGEDLWSTQMIEDFMGRFEGEAQSRLPSFAEAMVDQAIEREPESPYIDRLEEMLVERDPKYDPVGAWAQRQSRREPTISWGELAKFIKDESHWTGVPIHYRQHAVLAGAGIQWALGEEVNAEYVVDIVAAYEVEQTEYPDAVAWDRLRFTHGNTLLERGYPLFALDFGRAIKDPTIQQGFVLNCIDKGYEDEALELASTLPAPILAETLLFEEWSDDKATERLTELVFDEKYPLERRIALLEFIRDRALEHKEADEAQHYQRCVDALRNGQSIDGDAFTTQDKAD